ncbi:MAG TPA: phosphatase PAP2 family protein [Gaiellaceae bacterium]|nr:phosphatase PAP2 family protein [Gaiellaceae bacterium]
MNRRASLCAAAFVALTALVWAGAFTWLDRYAVGHLMPWGHFGHHRLIQVGSVFKPQTESTLGGTLVALWTYPASPFISGLIVLICTWRLRSVIPLGLWVAANVIELLGKLVVSRPSVGEPGFSDSFPSGHTVRAFVTAAVVAWVWRRAKWPALAWAVGVAMALVAIGDHVPTDVVGGALLAAALIYSAGTALPASSP